MKPMNAIYEHMTLRNKVWMFGQSREEQDSTRSMIFV